MADLVVDLYGTRIGSLRGDWRAFDLMFESSGVRTFGIDSPILKPAPEALATVIYDEEYGARPCSIALMARSNSLPRMTSSRKPTRRTTGKWRSRSPASTGTRNSREPTSSKRVAPGDSQIPNAPSTTRYTPCSKAFGTKRRIHEPTNS